jgi:hypothetical protein
MESWDLEEENQEISREELAAEDAPQDYSEHLDPQAEEAMDSWLEQEQEEEAEDIELILNARLRLEQGKLYEMLLKHDLFGQVDADPKAIANVQKEIRKFIKERLEILLGLRPDPRIAHNKPEPQKVEIPFNDLEVLTLKRMAAKFTNGATEKAELAQPLTASTRDSLVRPLSSTRPQAIQPVKQPMAAKIAQVQTKVARQPLPKKTVAIKPTTEVERIMVEEFGEEEKPLGKSIGQLKRSELVERNKRISMRQAARKASGLGAAAPLSPDQEAMVMMDHARGRMESLSTTGLGVAVAQSVQKAANVQE